MQCVLANIKLFNKMGLNSEQVALDESICLMNEQYIVIHNIHTNINVLSDSSFFIHYLCSKLH